MWSSAPCLRTHVSTEWISTASQGQSLTAVGTSLSQLTTRPFLITPSPLRSRAPPQCNAAFLQNGPAMARRPHTQAEPIFHQAWAAWSTWSGCHRAAAQWSESSRRARTRPPPHRHRHSVRMRTTRPLVMRYLPKAVVKTHVRGAQAATACIGEPCLELLTASSDTLP
jgi:hypothetical protein